MNTIKKNLTQIFLFVILATIFSLPVLTFAQSTGQFVPPPSNGLITNPLGDKNNSINGFIKTLLTALIKIGIPIIALAIVYCGFLFVSARGNPESITKAKDALVYTLIGAALLLCSWALAQLISSTVLQLN